MTSRTTTMFRGQEYLLDDRWPHLRLTESGAKRLDEMFEFADKLLQAGAPPEAKSQLIERFDYLEQYALNRETGLRNYVICLRSDWAPHCLLIDWFRASDNAHSFNGGLTYDGPGNESLTVSLVSQWWGIHT